MPSYRDAQVILLVADTEVAARFYGHFGFRETVRTVETPPIRIAMALDGFGLGLALPEPAAQSHGITPVTAGHRACISSGPTTSRPPTGTRSPRAAATTPRRTRSSRGGSASRSSKIRTATRSSWSSG